MITLNKKMFSIITIITLLAVSSGAYAYSNYYTIQNANVQIDASNVTIDNSNITIGQNNTITFPENNDATPVKEPTQPTPTPTSSPIPESSPIPTPTMPTFTVTIANTSYDVPTVVSTDPYTGIKTTTTGYTVECRTIEVVINNQPFVPWNTTNYNTVNFYYNIRVKGQYTDTWMELYGGGQYLWQSTSLTTTVSAQGKYSEQYGWINSPIYDRPYVWRELTFPVGAKIDFQVQAMIGYISNTPSPIMSSYGLTGEVSGWSDTQTITIS